VELIASGRDCDVFDVGDGTVVRRQRDGRSLEAEARVMRHVRGLGYPCPAVHRAEGAELVMDRVDGPTLLTDLLGNLTVERAAVAGTMLGELHHRLHRLPPLDTGQSQLHLDLHPDNVMLTEAGPVVIDWANATGGDPGYDLAMTWLIIVPFAASGIREVTALLDSFLETVGLEEARAGLQVAGPHRLADPNVTADERDAIRALLRNEGITI
jgi:aminoglycoside phosphotransferase (APT) family kinase protein